MLPPYILWAFYSYFGMNEVISSITPWTTCFECVGGCTCVCLFKQLCTCCSGNKIYCVGKSRSNKESQISSFSWMSWSQHLRQAIKTFVLFCLVLGFLICNQELLPLTNCFLLCVYKARFPDTTPTYFLLASGSSGIRSLLSVLGYRTQDQDLPEEVWLGHRPLAGHSLLLSAWVLLFLLHIPGLFAFANEDPVKQEWQKPIVSHPVLKFLGISDHFPYMISKQGHGEAIPC